MNLLFMGAHAEAMLNSRVGWTLSRMNDGALWARNDKGTDPNAR